MVACLSKRSQCRSKRKLLAEVRMVNFAIKFPCAATATQLEYKQTRVTRFLLTSAEESIVVARKLTQPEKRIAMKIANFSSE